MSGIDEQLAEDRALRDSARRLFKSDLSFVKSDLKGRNVGLRLTDRLGEGTADMLDDAAGFAGAHRGKLALGLLVAGLFLGRNRIIDGIAQLLFGDEEEPEDAETAQYDEATEPDSSDGSSEEERQFPAEMIDE